MEIEENVLLHFGRDHQTILSIDCTFDYDDDVENIYFDKIMKVKHFHDDVKPFDYQPVIDRYKNKFPNSELIMDLEERLKDKLYDIITERNIEHSYEA